MGVVGPPPRPWPSLSGIEMGCWQSLGDSHSDQDPGSRPAPRLPLALGLIVSRWQMPSRQLSFEVWGEGDSGGGKRRPCASCVSPLPRWPGFAPPLGWVLCYTHWWVTGSPTQKYCCFHNSSSNSNKQFSLPKSDQIICLDTHPAPIPATRAGPMASCFAPSAVTKLGSTLPLAEGLRTKLFP